MLTFVGIQLDPPGRTVEAWGRLSQSEHNSSIVATENVGLKFPLVHSSGSPLSCLFLLHCLPSPPPNSQPTLLLLGLVYTPPLGFRLLGD